MSRFIKDLHTSLKDETDVSFAEARREELILLRTAIDAANNCITISDPRQKDNPLIYVNRGFEKLTGYSYDEVVGHNCRFLQNEHTQQAGLDKIRSAVKKGQDTRAIIKNFRKDGSAFYNELYISAVRDEAGELIYFMGVQNDVTAQVKQKRNLRRALEKVFEDPSWLNQMLLEHIMELDPDEGDMPQVGQLTKRELATLELVARGLTNPAIAQELSISANTVRNHVQAIYKKLGVNARVDLVLWARARGFGDE